jgi:hypothetical protein
MHPRILRLAAIALFLLGCHHGDASPPVCGLNDDGGALDVAGRVDGLYGVVDGHLAAAPIAHFERMARTGSGIGAQDGKKWVGVHLASDEARAVQEFTASPQGRGFVGVVGGAVVLRHKVRTPITSANAQVSCCNPRYCERWEALLADPLRDSNL